MFATIALLAALAGAPQQAHDPAVDAAIPVAAQRTGARSGGR